MQIFIFIFLDYYPTKIKFIHYDSVQLNSNMLFHGHISIFPTAASLVGGLRATERERERERKRESTRENERVRERK